MSRRYQSLLKFARKNRFSSLQESYGACFHAALQIGVRARELGLEDRVRFLHWRVRNDANFREHWALSFRKRHALDVTAVQVDGDPNPLRTIDSYPLHFGTPRDYPLSLILRQVPSSLQAASGDRVAAALIWRVQRSMIVYDSRRTPMPGVISPLFTAAGRLTETLFVLSLHGLSNWARGRLTTLESRLSRSAVLPHGALSNSPVSPESPLVRARVRRAAVEAPHRVARAVCALFFLGVPV